MLIGHTIKKHDTPNLYKYLSFPPSKDLSSIHYTPSLSTSSTLSISTIGFAFKDGYLFSNCDRCQHIILCAIEVYGKCSEEARSSKGSPPLKVNLMVEMLIGEEFKKKLKLLKLLNSPEHNMKKYQIYPYLQVGTC